MLETDLIIDLHHNGVSIRTQKSPSKTLISFSQEISSIVSSSPAIHSLILPSFIGLIKFQPGFLVFVLNNIPLLNQNKFQLDSQIYKVGKVLIIPLEYDEATAVFQKYSYLSGDDIIQMEDSCGNIDDLDDTESIKEDTGQVQPFEQDNLFFSKMGVHIKNSKTDPVLGLNNKNIDHYKCADDGDGLKTLIEFLSKNMLKLNTELSEYFDNEDDNENNEETNEEVDDDEDNKNNESDEYNDTNKKIVNNTDNNKINSDTTESDLTNDDIPILITLNRTITISKSRSKSISFKKSSNWLQTTQEKLRMSQKILTSIKKFFNKGDFYYSFDLDLTKQLSINNNSLTPHHKQDLNETETDFFFNKYLINDFLSCDFATPLIQGYIDTFDIDNLVGGPETDNLGQVLLISKRSTKRCGVRYLRRGVDDEGNVANFVETNQYIMVKQGEQTKFARYSLIRGSMPIFFEQDPSKLSPIPYPIRSCEQNNEKFKLHFENLSAKYPQVTCVSLIEKSPKECQVGKLFQDLSKENKVQFTWFDFHHMCKKMKYENIKYLLGEPIENSKIDNLKIGQQIDNYKWYEPNKFEQAGILRINCIDCLDRTNVVSKFLCSKIINDQLDSWNLKINDSNFNFKFNHLWANNGDSISKQYTSTNALKGDFTRFEKRNYQGLINDAILTLFRYYYGYISDFFQQILIDYLVGNYKENLSQILEEFESNLNNIDPNLINEKLITEKLIFSHVRQVLFNNEINLNKSEFVIDHWFTLSNYQINHLKNSKLKPALLIISNKFLYLINYSNDKILSYYKIKIDSILKLQYGVYISNSFKSFERNPKKNIGLKFHFRDYEYKNKDDNDSASILSKNSSTQDSTNDINYLSIKFPQSFEYRKIKSILKLISKICFQAELIHEDIVNQVEAKKDVSIYNYLSYKFKKMVWT